MHTNFVVELYLQVFPVFRCRFRSNQCFLFDYTDVSFLESVQIDIRTKNVLWPYFTGKYRCKRPNFLSGSPPEMICMFRVGIEKLNLLNTSLENTSPTYTYLDLPAF